MAAANALNRSVQAATVDGSDSGQLYRLLRYAHIFASLVREVMEIKYLSESTSHKLTLSQLHLLKLISLNGQHQVGEIADFLGVSSPAATKNIDKLERLGLVTRTPSTGDRRAILLSSSAKGRRLVERYEELKAERLVPVLGSLSSQEIAQMGRLLEKFSLALVREEDSGDGLCLRCSAYYDEHCPVRHIRDGCPYHKLRQLKSEPDNRPEKATAGAT